MTTRSKVIIDANVVVKWVVDEDKSEVELSRKIYMLMQNDFIRVLSPDYLLIELAQIFSRKKKLDSNTSKKFLYTIRNCGIEFTYVDFGVLDELIDISKQYNQSIYDSIYLKLAMENRCKIVTFDEKVWKQCNLAISPKEFLKELES